MPATIKIIFLFVMIPEEEAGQSNSQKLPDTCPISQTDLSQPLLCSSQNTQKPWGRLYPTKPDIRSLGKLFN